MFNFFRRKKEKPATANDYFESRIEQGIQKFSRAEKLDLNSPLAGIMLQSYLSNFKSSVMKDEELKIGIGKMYSLHKFDIEDIIEASFQKVHSKYLK